ASSLLAPLACAALLPLPVVAAPPPLASCRVSWLLLLLLALALLPPHRTHPQGTSHNPPELAPQLPSKAHFAHFAHFAHTLLLAAAACGLVGHECLQRAEQLIGLLQLSLQLR